ncbi:unnamed protein product [Soboliphyme baturini]|uniref:Death domain-containing protein n=1 Tax=Soboliphyme baturini TaxID=241478 RepID=A0A183IXE6_9BILA|nr:unnamed protein product [Soboliphyme baturini]
MGDPAETETTTFLSDEALQVAISSQDITAVQKLFDESTEKEADKRLIVDQYFRSVLTHEFLQKKSTDETLKFVNFSIDVATADFCSKYTPVTLLSDIFDCSVIMECEKIFDFVEQHVRLWEVNEGFDVCRNHLLRMCNDLLRRLSRTINTEFCGRILVFLAKCLPLMEKSGLNLTSQFNIDNVTRYESVKEGDTKEVSADDAALMNVEEGEMSDNAGEQTSPVDYNLYCKFWQLQSFFAAPTNCYEKFGWRQFQHNTAEILSTFACQKLEDTNHTKPRFCKDADLSKPDVCPAPSDEKEASFKPAKVPDVEMIDTEVLQAIEDEKKEPCLKNEYFAKYLTNQRLIQLQLSDSNFRRSILTQFLITFQYLTADIKFKDKKICVLTDEQLQWINEMTEKCYVLLSQTHPDGKHFAEVVKHILEREELWNEWKNNGCPDFTKMADRDVMRPFKKRLRKRNPGLLYDLGNPVLTALWNQCSDKLESCKEPQRQFVPDVDVFFKEAVEQSAQNLPTNSPEKLVNNENFQWRALRLLAMKSCHFFTPPNLQVTRIPPYLETLIGKTVQDGPKTLIMREDPTIIDSSSKILKEKVKVDMVAETHVVSRPKDGG